MIIGKEKAGHNPRFFRHPGHQFRTQNLPSSSFGRSVIPFKEVAESEPCFPPPEERGIF
jgi:hypothetical protein